MKKNLKLLEEEKEKALEDVEFVRLEARDEINKLRVHWQAIVTQKVFQKSLRAFIIFYKCQKMEKERKFLNSQSF